MDSILSWFNDPKVIAIVAPLLVMVVKKVAPTIPKVLLPILSVLLGAALAGLAGAPVVATGVVGGAAGVAVREIYDQGKKALGQP